MKSMDISALCSKIFRMNYYLVRCWCKWYLLNAFTPVSRKTIFIFKNISIFY